LLVVITKLKPGFPLIPFSPALQAQ
jgi:hypothetical protein